MQNVHGKVSAAEAVALAHCLVESDAVLAAQCRSLRRKSLLISLSLQTLLLAALVGVPLLATGERPSLRLLLIPSYRGVAPTADHAGSDRPAQGARKSPPKDIYQPTRIPHGVKNLGPEATTGEESSVVDRPGVGVPTGLLPSLENDRRAWFLAKPAPPAPPLMEQKRIRRSEGVQQALLVERVEPVYPVIAKQIHLEGTVQLRAIIGRDGRVNSLQALSGNAILVKAALDAVSRWRYRPTLLNGQPVEVETYITVIFQLVRK